MKDCILKNRECIDCAECDICDLDDSKTCDSCGKCIETDAEYVKIKIDEIVGSD